MALGLGGGLRSQSDLVSFFLSVTKQREIVVFSLTSGLSLLYLGKGPVMATSMRHHVSTGLAKSGKAMPAYFSLLV